MPKKITDVKFHIIFFIPLYLLFNAFCAHKAELTILLTPQKNKQQQFFSFFSSHSTREYLINLIKFPVLCLLLVAYLALQITFSTYFLMIFKVHMIEMLFKNFLQLIKPVNKVASTMSLVVSIYFFVDELMKKLFFLKKA